MDINRCFEILELDSKASPDEVKQAYRDMVNVWHPDRFPDNSRLKQKAEEKLKEINEAYEKVLSFLSSSGEAEKTTLQFHSNRKTSTTFQICPWIRFLARSIDYLLFGFFLISINVNRIISKFDILIIFFPVFLIFIWIFVEAGFLSIFGTTPGKWLLRTRVVNIFRNKPGFLSAFRRSLSVWCNGMGVGIPFITPITMVISYYKLKKEGHTVWDRDSGFFVVHRKISKPRAMLAVLFFIVFSVLNTYKIHQQIKITMQGIGITDNKQNIKTRHDYAEASYKLGVVYAELGRYEEAIESYKQAICSKPDYTEAQYSLGVSYAKLHLHEDAIKVLKEAIQSRPDYAEAHHILGLMYLIHGNKSAAFEQYRILKDLDKELADELFKYIESIFPQP